MFQNAVLALAVFSLSLVSVSYESLRAEPAKILDVAYKSNPATDYERERCKLDLYLPQSERGFPTLLWFHGGSIQAGDKAGRIAVDVATRFAESGVAVASVNYRLSPRAKFPAYLEDAAASLAWVRRE
ncbi:MAG: alpha/beta hydrolase, partial [Planctomycetota bacterium]